LKGKKTITTISKEISFALAKEIRDKDYQTLLTYVRSEWVKYIPVLPGLAKLRYAKSDRSDILYLLARIACHLEAYDLNHARAVSRALSKSNSTVTSPRTLL
jgi:hypothetical protein